MGQGFGANPTILLKGSALEAVEEFTYFELDCI